ncbi:MAG TPA: hypothetical protein DCE80_05075 [Ignavibacteriales bacterium]|nr:hypothetical protein [Ignavibacteriales bacterium]
MENYSMWNKWLKQNAEERMDANNLLFDRSRAEYHLSRYRFALDCIHGQDVLDIACGTGYGTKLLASRAKRVIGIDLNEKTIEYANQSYSGDNITYLVANAGKIPLDNSSIDAVVSFETIEHVSCDRTFLNEVKRVLRPGGKFILSTPNGYWENPFHLRGYNYSSFKNILSEYFKDIYVFNHNSNPVEPQNVKIERSTDSNCNMAECFLAVCRKEDIVRHSRIKQYYDDVEEVDVAILGSEEWVGCQYQNIVSKMPFTYLYVNDIKFENIIRYRPKLVLCHDETSIRDVRICIKKLKNLNIPILVIEHGIIEWRNTWVNPVNIENTTLFRPVISDKIAVLGNLHQRIITSWGSGDKCAKVGLPRLDPLILDKSRYLNKNIKTILVMTAKTAGFTDKERELTKKGIIDLKNEIGKISGTQLRYRLTQGLAEELDVPNELNSFYGELHDILRTVDAVVTTQSTVILEAMLLGIPTACLDYTNVPQYIRLAWNINCKEQILPVVDELLNPPKMKMEYQNYILHDVLECETPASPRLISLIGEMLYSTTKSSSKTTPISFTVDNEKIKSTTVQKIMEDGCALFSEGKLSESKQMFEKVLTMEPKNAEAINNIGVILSSMGDIKASKNKLMSAIEIDPDYRDAVRNLRKLLNY